MRIKIVKLRDNFVTPSYQTEQSAGMDAYAALDAPVTLKPLERKLIPLGFKMELPKGYEAQIRARSGLSLKNGITMVNGVGTIDADYRGEVGALVINLGQENFVISPNDRVAQIIISKFDKITWDITDKISDSKRSDRGFGSTGI